MEAMPQKLGTSTWWGRSSNQQSGEKGRVPEACVRRDWVKSAEVQPGGREMQSEMEDSRVETALGERTGAYPL